jgi:uncharacterized protein (TIGR02246 family)
MTDDEQAIREVVETWVRASRSGDTATVLSLMTKDVVFMVPGQEPFGRDAFEAAADAQGAPQIDGTNEIVEMQVLGDWAFTRKPHRPDGHPAQGRSGTAQRLYADALPQGRGWPVEARPRCQPLNGRKRFAAGSVDHPPTLYSYREKLRSPVLPELHKARVPRPCGYIGNRIHIASEVLTPASDQLVQ